MNKKPARPARSVASQKGLTLLELLVVLLILGLMAMFAVPQVMNLLASAKSNTAKIQTENISSILDLYRLETGTYPTQEQGLAALLRAPAGAKNWNGPYVKKEAMLMDPWGNPYRYKLSGKSGGADVFSFGADNAEGGDGENADVGNW